MDCFFVAVVTRNHADLLEKPITVCHSDSPRGTAEISSANYPARDYGVKAGMFVRYAKACCPQLLIVPYNFEANEEVADQFYKILHKHCNKVQVDEYLVELPIKAFPGIGHVLEEKLKKKGVQTCGQLRMFSKESLQRDCGLKNGEMLWNHCRGVDNQAVGVIQECKSVGAEVNWGVRFKDTNDSQHFLLSLCKEVSLRLQGRGMPGRTFTLKIKKRRKNAEEPAKYMGCGDCENLSHSTMVPVATDDVDVLQRITMWLFGLFHIGQEKNTIRSWLASGAASASEQCIFRDMGQLSLEPSASSPLISDQSHNGTS